MRLLMCMMILLGCLAAVGCKVDPNGDSVAMAGGRVEGTIQAPVEKVTGAARKVAIDLKLTVVQYKSDETAGLVVAYTHWSQRIVIETKAGKDQRTRVSVQTEGEGGDSASAEVMRRLRKAV